MMTLFPVLMYYLWICLTFYDGQLARPTNISDIQPFIYRMVGHVKDVRMYDIIAVSMTNAVVS